MCSVRMSVLIGRIPSSSNKPMFRVEYGTCIVCFRYLYSTISSDGISLLLSWQNQSGQLCPAACRIARAGQVKTIHMILTDVTGTSKNFSYLF